MYKGKYQEPYVKALEELKNIDNPNFRELSKKQIESYKQKMKKAIDTKSGNHLSQTFEFFKSLKLDENKNFLDIGCQTDLLKNYVKNWTGCDIVSNGYNIDVCSNEDLIYEDKSFEIIFNSHTLEHTISPLVALMEMKRVLKDKGDIILGVPVYPGFLTSEHFYVLPLRSWELLIRNCGFIIIQQSNVISNCVTFHLRKNEDTITTKKNKIEIFGGDDAKSGLPFFAFLISNDNEIHAETNVRSEKILKRIEENFKIAIKIWIKKYGME